ncbi:MAG: 23S rRNA (adenine(2503)-C(2))-methyltransferase RlmN [Polyangiales bacterium]
MSDLKLAPAQNLAEQLPHEWEAVLSAWGEPRYRALQIFRWIQQRGVLDPALMSDLPKRLRDRLAQEGLSPLARASETHVSEDGTRKLVVEFADQKLIETVLIPRGSVAADDIYAVNDDEPGAPPPAAGELTQCVSSQVGCAMGCVFCASGIAGLKRQMSAAEIVSQVLLGRAALDDSARLAGVVFMGMGEPLANYDALVRAIVLLSHPEGIGMSLRRMTVSTSGLVPEIDRLANDFAGQIQLAVSVHAADTETRTRLMPINKKYPLPDLIAAVRRYPVPRRRRLTIEYTLVRGMNDSREAATRLAGLLRGLRSKVNLIPMNSVDATVLSAPDDDVVDAFQRVLRDAGIDTFLRKRKGDDIAAACGQLALRGATRKVRNEFVQSGG